MSNKKTAFLVGLTSVTFFTGCIVFTTVADQTRNAAQSPVTGNTVVLNNLTDIDGLPHAQPNTLPQISSDYTPINTYVRDVQSPTSQDVHIIALAKPPVEGHPTEPISNQTPVPPPLALPQPATPATANPTTPAQPSSAPQPTTPDSLKIDTTIKAQPASPAANKSKTTKTRAS